MRGRRDQQLHFRVSKPELDRIQVKMAELGIVSIQYAKRANESGRVYQTDIEDLRARLDELIGLAKQILAQLAAL